MNNILIKFKDCDMFSLTGNLSMNKYNITEEEFEKNINKQEKRIKDKISKFYEKIDYNNENYPEIDELYEKVKKECYEFNKEGIINKVGKTTKYGSTNREFFLNIYMEISKIVKLQNSKNEYCIKNGISPLEQIPVELKPHLLSYEVSSSNAVTNSDKLMINYYFRLSDETKRYLLNFRNDFLLKPLEDLAIYKNNQMLFYSCTHEEYNSIKVNYKKMSKEEINDFINDELFEEENKEIIGTINKIIDMPIGNTFSFKEFGITSKSLMTKICNICEKLNLFLVSPERVEDNNSIKIKEIPAYLCELEDIIEKKY